MKVIAYLRVSTKGQAGSGLGLEAQREYIATAAHSYSWDVVGEYADTASGSIAPDNREQFMKAIGACKSERAILVVAKLDRLSRDVEHVARIMKEVDFKVATMPTADKFQLHLYAALAEQERTFIANRTRDALKALKQRAQNGNTDAIAKIESRDAGRKLAHQMQSHKLATAARQNSSTAFAKSIEKEIKSCMFDEIITLQGIADCLNNKNVKTPHGKNWSPTGIKRIIEKLGINKIKKAS